MEAGLDIGFPGRAEIGPAQLVERAHRRPGPGVQHQEVRADVGQHRLGAGFVAHVQGHRVDAPSCPGGVQCGRLPCNHGHPGALGDQRFDQSQSQATAAAGHDHALVFEVHPCAPQ
jgi:hypothetical protein